MTEEREMTAPMTSVGAEVGQSPDLTPIIPDYGENFKPSEEEMYEVQMQYEQEMQAQAQTEYEKSPGFMQTVSMPELYEMVYPGKPPIIEHFLYPGTYLFVGAPKVGKSFMMAQIAYHVSSGTPMWNYSVRKGTVLYLALEDDYRRLQERLYRMFGTETASNLFFDRISGTNGLLGAADGAFIMYKSKRTDGDATIEVSGRDQPDRKFTISRNRETLCRDFKGEQSPNYAEPPEPVLETIGNSINADNPAWEVTAAELIEKLELDIKPNTLSLKLNVNAGKLYNLYFVQYSNKRTHKAKLIQLRYDARSSACNLP